MRKLFLIIAFILLPAGLISQSTQNVDLYISAGVSVPFSTNDFGKFYQRNGLLAFNPTARPFSDYWNSGFNIGLGFGYPLSWLSPSLSIIVEANFNSFTLDKPALLKGLGLTGSEYADDVTMKAASIGLSAKYILPMPELFFDPYVVGGAGFSSIATDDVSILASPSNIIGGSFATQQALNTSVGAGVDIRGGESSGFFLEARYVVIYNASKSPVSRGDNFSYFPVRVGFRGVF
jgi:hypothetical protein